MEQSPEYVLGGEANLRPVLDSGVEILHYFRAQEVANDVDTRQSFFHELTRIQEKANMGVSRSRCTKTPFNQSKAEYALKQAGRIATPVRRTFGKMRLQDAGRDSRGSATDASRRKAVVVKRHRRRRSKPERLSGMNSGGRFRELVSRGKMIAPVSKLKNLKPV